MAKSVLITGCSSGIGKDAAVLLHAKGYKVFATARQPKDVDDLLALGLESHLLDLSDSASIESGLEWVLNQTGGTLDVLINNGAYGQPGAVEDLTTDVLREQFEVNFFGWHHLTRLVIPVMRKQGSGRIIQNSSILGFVSMPFRGAYNASKHALEGLTDTLRLELKGSGIEVVLIEPGPIQTKFVENALAKIKSNIDIESSFHSDAYKKQLSRLGREEGYKKSMVNRFFLPPSSVSEKMLEAIEQAQPKARYYVTLPTHVFGFLKRVLPTRTLDILLSKG